MASKTTLSAKQRLPAKAHRVKVKAVDGKRTIRVTVRLDDEEWSLVERARAILSPHVKLKDGTVVRELMLLGARGLLNSKKK